MSKDKSIGVSNTVFAMGLIIAILVSSLISIVIAMRFVGPVGPQGPKGDTGATGPQGPKGDTGAGIEASASVSVSPTASTTSTDWVDIPGTAVTLTLGNTSDLLIMFTSEAMNSDPSGRVQARAMLGSSAASPAPIALTPIVGDTNTGTPHITLAFGTYACNFYVPSVSPGTYTIKMQWVVSGVNGISAGTDYVAYRTLSVIALFH